MLVGEVDVFGACVVARVHSLVLVCEVEVLGACFWNLPEEDREVVMG